MTVTLNIPDDVASNLGIEEPALPRAMLEAFAIEGYREGRWSAKQVRLILGHDSRWQTEDFLSAHDVWPGLTVEDVLEDTRVAEAAMLRP
ncbi:MAG: UPF0175 family protein [Verrucomicrobia bacterium]|nr:UPF0175 family protein [Verrucomicrobiota bacterium]